MLVPRTQPGLCVLLGSTLLLLVLARPGIAQYMYLDSNGDGVHTAADQVNVSGSTTVDIWLDSDSNRDGSAADCPSEPGALLTINSYVFILQAVDGTITWGGYTNQFPNAAIHFGQGSTSSLYWNGFGSSIIQPPGLYRLGTLTLSAASGTPSIQIIPSAFSLTSDETSFGTGCDGPQLDNTSRLGEDWFDVDGLSFGGGASHAPLLAPIDDLTVSVGETASQALSATDADGQALTFSMVSGPAYAHVLTMDGGTGTASGSIHAAPFLSDIGSTSIVVGVSDGASTDEHSLTSTVAASPNHEPSWILPGSITAVAGVIRRVPLGGSDADGQQLHWRLVSGPAYATVLDLQTRAGGAAGILQLAPPISATGSSPVTVGLGDGVSETLHSTAVEVLPSPPAPAIPLHRSVNEDFGVALATGDFDGDGLADMATANGAGNSINVYRSLPGGGLQNLGEMAVGNNPTSIATGDFNEDGKVDLVVSNRSDGTVSVLIGNGQGAFQSLPAQPAGNSAILVRCADTNRDGHLDLVLPTAGDNRVSSLLGRGDGTFTAAPSAPVGGPPQDLALGDFNLDGRLDLAVVSSGEILLLRGFGDGTFAASGTLAAGGSPEAIVTADWNSDGLLDLAVRHRDPTASIQILLAQTDGTFHESTVLTAPIITRGLAAGDLDLDGHPDLAVSSATPDLELLLYQGAGDGTFPVRRVLTLPGTGAIALADGDHDGYADLFLNLEVGEVALRMNPFAGLVEARAFSKGDKPISLQGGGSVCILVEPVHDSYDNSDLDVSSIRLISPGTGTVNEIGTVPSKSAVESDSDRNGVNEVSVCFSRTDINRLFIGIRGKQTVTARVEGRLVDGKAFSTLISLLINGNGGGNLAATVSPNPLNPRAVLNFSTSREGAVTIRVYDLQGRLVRTLLEQPLLPAGSHHVDIDGRAQNGQALASGIYFYEVRAAEGTARGRMTILK